MKRLEYRFHLGDQSWTVDFATLDVDTWIMLERATGLRRKRLAVEFFDMSALGAKAAIFLCRRLAGEQVEYADVQFVLDDFDFEQVAVDLGAKANGQKPDPTKAATTGPGSPTS